MGNVQEQFNSCTSENFTLTPGEYEGPLVINRPCVVDGAQSTLWANKGPVLTVSARNVTIKDLRIEVTDDLARGTDNIALKSVGSDTKLENVEVRGNVVGIPQEAENWNLPGVIALGEFAANNVNSFSVSINVPSPAVINNKMQDLKISPVQLHSGRNNLLFTTSELRNNTILYGEIIVQSAVSRRVCVMGKALNSAPVHNETIPIVNEPQTEPLVRLDLPPDIIAPQESDSPVQPVRKGQRLVINDTSSAPVKIIYEHAAAPDSMDIDSYCFALQDNGKVSCDEDLIFFGNTKSSDSSIESVAANGKSVVSVALDKVDASVSKIAVCYSIYGDNSEQNFSKVSKPLIRFFEGNKETYRFELTDLTSEKTVVAAEIYRYKGKWKISFVGSGYNSGLKQLCESYGVNVE